MTVLTDSPGHHVRGLVASIIRAGDRVHQSGIIPNHDNLASGRQESIVQDTTERPRRQAGAVDNNVCLLPRVVSIGGVCHMCEDGSFEDDAIFSALAY
jgi:hypothetical protein